MAEEVVSNSLSHEIIDEAPPTRCHKTPSLVDSTMVAASRPMDVPVSPDMTQKKRFAVFVKILFRELHRSENGDELRDVAKAILLDCTHRNRLGDPAYHPLMEAVDQRLRRHVGETHWRRALVYLQHYMKQTNSDEPRPTLALKSPVRTAFV
jgi:hypothetical protein